MSIEIQTFCALTDLGVRAVFHQIAPTNPSKAEELQREHVWWHGRGGSANIVKKRSCALKFDTEATAAPPLVDLSALREMYSAAVTLSIDYSQEVSRAENIIGRSCIMCSCLKCNLEKKLSIVRHRKGARLGATVRSRILPAPPRTINVGAR